MVLSVSFHFFKWLPAGIGPGADKQLSDRQAHKAELRHGTAKQPSLQLARARHHAAQRIVLDDIMMEKCCDRMEAE